MRLIDSCVVCLKSLDPVQRDKGAMCVSMEPIGDGIKLEAPSRPGRKLI